MGVLITATKGLVDYLFASNIFSRVDCSRYRFQKQQRLRCRVGFRLYSLIYPSLRKFAGYLIGFF